MFSYDLFDDNTTSTANQNTSSNTIYIFFAEFLWLITIWWVGEEEALLYVILKLLVKDYDKEWGG